MARERAVPAEPTVVVATGIAAFDEWGHALGARVHDGRSRADTIPAEREVAASTSRQATVLLLVAAVLMLASAAVLVRGIGAGRADIAGATAAQPQTSVVETSAAALSEAPAPPPGPAAILVADLPATEVAPEVEAPREPARAAPTPRTSPAPSAERPPRRARPAARSKRSASGAGGGGEIVRDMPY